jgi:hypothetical protein
VVPLHDVWVGLVKAPVFGLIVAVAGCYQGMQVKANAEEVGTRTTAAVVMAIFMVIVLDAFLRGVLHQGRLGMSDPDILIRVTSRTCSARMWSKTSISMSGGRDHVVGGSGTGKSVLMRDHRPADPRSGRDRGAGLDHRRARR